MTTNLYSQRTYQEHPIKSWSLEETEFSEQKEFNFDYDDLIVPNYSWPDNSKPEGVWARSLSFGDDYFEEMFNAAWNKVESKSMDSDIPLSPKNNETPGKVKKKFKKNKKQ